MSAIDNFESVLKKHGYSTTGQRRELFEVLASGDSFTMRQLVQKLEGKMNRTSVYRGIELFEKVGVVNRIHIGWKYKLELSEAFSGHHHHASCTECGAVAVFEEDKQLESGIHMLAESMGFRLDGHALELRGICKSCSTAYAG